MSASVALCVLPFFPLRLRRVDPSQRMMSVFRSMGFGPIRARQPPIAEAVGAVRKTGASGCSACAFGTLAEYGHHVVDHLQKPAFHVEVLGGAAAAHPQIA
jgi:hypothetical protein